MSERRRPIPRKNPAVRPLPPDYHDGFYFRSAGEQPVHVAADGLGAAGKRELVFIDLQAGRYVIVAKAVLANYSDRPVPVNCVLTIGYGEADDQYDVTLPPHAPPKSPAEHCVTLMQGGVFPHAGAVRLIVTASPKGANVKISQLRVAVMRVDKLKVLPD